MNLPFGSSGPQQLPFLFITVDVTLLVLILFPRYLSVNVQAEISSSTDLTLQALLYLPVNQSSVNAQIEFSSPWTPLHEDPAASVAVSNSAYV